MAMIFPKKEERNNSRAANGQSQLTLFRGVSRLKRNHQFVFATVLALGIISFWHGMTRLFDFYFLSASGEIGAWVLVMLGLLVLLSSDYFTRVFTGEK